MNESETERKAIDAIITPDGDAVDQPTLAPLVRLLRSNEPLSGDFRWYLAGLIDPDDMILNVGLRLKRTNARRRAIKWQDKNGPIIEAMIAHLAAGKTVQGAADAVAEGGIPSSEVWCEEQQKFVRSRNKCSSRWAIEKWVEAGRKWPLLYGRAERAVIRKIVSKLREEVELVGEVLASFIKKLK